MGWGFFKKMVIADRLAVVVNTVYANPSEQNAFAITIAVLFFPFQIYCDFSGYSDIARGAAQVLGFRLMVNFNRPYFASSLSDFWRRWHISLSTWFRDYLYVPLGGSRTSGLRTSANLFIVFLMSGLWHGANWTFVLWGSLHGFFLVVERSFRQQFSLRGPLQNGFTLLVLKSIGIVCTFSLVSLLWVFFRASSVSDAWFILSKLLSGFKALFDLQMVASTVFTLGLNYMEFPIALLSILFLILFEGAQRYVSFGKMLDRLPWLPRWVLYYLLIFSILHFGIMSQAPFIYFQF
jgi:D-alanyl-lipoteichoic acid acyltransferase DltB (MBOAT superfamily)